MSLVQNESHCFAKKEIQYLTKLRIIKKNLVHVHGFPQSIAKTDILQSKEYFGQYGKILNFLISSKVNRDNNRPTFSAYITYSNEIEAACAILCVDSLLIQGKIIRAFFGTTKYCSYFLNNKKCKNSDNCMFLHQFGDNKDIIIDDNMIFTYDDHINLAKKLIHYYSSKIKNEILNMEKPKKIIFPFIDFIYLNEEEKENYFTSGNISYVGSDSKVQNENLNNNFNGKKSETQNINNYINSYQVNNIIINLNNKSDLNQICYKDNCINNNCVFSKTKNVDMYNNSLAPIKFHKSIDESLKHIFAVKPFYDNLNNYPTKKLEFEFFRKALEKNGENFYELFDGCTDCLKDII